MGLDPIATREFYERVARLKARGCTLILCSHVLPGVERYIDRALILGNGRRLAEGSLEQLRQNAELPLTVTLSGKGLKLPDDLAARATTGPAGLLLKVPLSEKIATLQRLLPLPGLDNLDMHLPSLEDLYSHFILSQTEAQS
ncbi:hypothetical protein [Marinobacterium aestuariivivens]|uniref:ABC transporter ATP-binding protein n=1 Tax=Marinobacterium aestuariivivens TaxID=1698799 RepID=A0ABW2A4T9_9GAMM